MQLVRVTILSLCLVQTAAYAGQQDPPGSRHQIRRKASVPSAPAKPVAHSAPTDTPMFGDGDRPETAAERAASLERRRKAFFTAPSGETDAPPSEGPSGVTLGGSNGLTPGMGLKF